ncbi:hypothetical protein BO94DRAFT_530709 [Aspergillus sclerotioniger CBS 115572]|uniref:Uncharacterized protein n=1 Tax=Aspergillus sclerotioniger CBS 115572 TaxID=1450535 RepID=A0A317XDZ7_9EURO|nr:hypothetical protein BO94DRAFT_530709 [Aspergillus sclerotioniger CBS 115572]PWY95972.1 hypothetical protein BO94DRAFT_530709 [Aspergillus sclerotioniger CBS 115572]
MREIAMVENSDESQSGYVIVGVVKSLSRSFSILVITSLYLRNTTLCLPRADSKPDGKDLS